MNEIELLEMEIGLMLDTIKRLKAYKEKHKSTYINNSLVVGELKHRAVAMKQRLTAINKLASYNILAGE